VREVAADRARKRTRLPSDADEGHARGRHHRNCIEAKRFEKVAAGTMVHGGKKLQSGGGVSLSIHSNESRDMSTTHELTRVYCTYTPLSTMM
jgi:hypothetical protein